MSLTTPKSTRPVHASSVEIPIAPKGKVIAAALVVVGLVAVAAWTNVFSAIFAVLCFGIAARFAFGMTIRADETGLRIPRLHRTVHIPREDLHGVQHVEPQEEPDPLPAPEISTLLIYGRNYEISALPFHEHDADSAARFAKELQEFFELAPDPEDFKSFETARRLHKHRSLQDAELVRAGAITLGLVAAGAHFTSQVALGTSPLWVLPVCVIVFACAAWFGRQFWRGYTTRLDWDFYW